MNKHCLIMLPTPSKSLWFEQRSSFISLEDIIVGVQFTPRQGELYGSEICRNAQRCSWPAWSLFTKILTNSFITILLEIVPDRNRGWRCSPKSPSKFLLNLNSAVRFCKSQNHKGSLTWCKLHTHHDVFQTDKWRLLFKPRAFGWCW